MTDRQPRPGQHFECGQCYEPEPQVPRPLTNAELADLPDGFHGPPPWLNATWDTSRYTGSVMSAWLVSEALYEQHRKAGGLCLRRDLARLPEWAKGAWIIA